MKPKWLDRVLIVNPCYYTLCTTPKMFATEIKRLGIKYPPRFLSTNNADATTHWFEQEGELCAVVTITPHKNRHQVYALLVHEAVHIWQKIRRELSEHEPSMEFEAYAIQGLSLALFNEYKRQMKGRR